MDRKHLKKITLILTMTTLLSCSKEEELVSQNQSKELDTTFFNLEVGNTWVYSHYYKPKDGTHDFVKSGIKDTLKITKKVIQDGKVYYQQELTSTSAEGKIISLVSVNDFGHLVDYSGATIHPGDDFIESNYISGQFYAKGIDKVDIENSKLEGPVTIGFENKQFDVYSFEYAYTEAYNISRSYRQTKSHYQKGVGLVKEDFYYKGYDSSYPPYYEIIKEVRLDTLYNSHKNN